MHPTWSSERKSGFVALVMYGCIYVCGVNSMSYTRLQLFLGICTGVITGSEPKDSSSSFLFMCMLFLLP